MKPAQMNSNSAYHSFNKGLWPQRLASDGAWQLLVVGLLRRDR